MPNPAEVAHGPALIGLWFNILLLGIMMTQTMMYFTNFKRDKFWMKVFVGALFLADSVNSVFDCVWIYQSLILNFGNTEYLSVANWVFGTDPAMTGIISMLVQLFFAWRVKVLTGKIWLVLIIGTCAVVAGLSGVGTAVAVGMIPEFIHFQKFQVIVAIWLAVTCVCDGLITATLTWHLRKHKTGFPATDDVVNKIIRLTVQTGMITSLVAIIDLALFLGNPTGLHLAFNFPLSKLYTNSLMSTLNSRGGWNYSTGGSTTQPSLDNRMGAQILPRKNEVVSLSQKAKSEVYVSVESHQMVDMDNKSANAFNYDTEAAVMPNPYGGK